MVFFFFHNVFIKQQQDDFLRIYLILEETFALQNQVGCKKNERLFNKLKKTKKFSLFLFISVKKLVNNSKLIYYLNQRLSLLFVDMKIGYARVSTFEQSLDLQIDALSKAGCDKIITDKISGSVTERPGLNEMEKFLRKGDTVVVYSLDRLGRTLKHLIEWLNFLQEKEIGFESLQERIDTTTPTGKLNFHIFASLAEFERNLLRERTMAGLNSARVRGRKGGRPIKLNEKQKKIAINLYESEQHTIQEICQTVGVSRPTLYKYLRENQENHLSDEEINP